MPADPVVPVHVPGPRGPWSPLRESLLRHGLAVAYGWVPQWTPDRPDGPSLRRLLGTNLPHYLTLSHPRARERYLASRVFFRHTAAQAMDAPAQSVDIAYMPHGRPYVRGCAELELGLSHAGPLLVAAVSRHGRVGVDAEAADRWLGGEGWENSVCTPQERALLVLLPPERRNGELIRLWTLKEAYSKAMGQGMRYPFDRIGFARPGPPQRSLGPDGDWHPVAGWDCSTATVPGAERTYLVSWVHRRPPTGPAHTSHTPGWAMREVLAALRPGPVRRPEPWRAP
ncbi:4'-phosphopantetheinyl transferase superfamily protein [Streptomyces sp. NPDC048290]|uniref:4'-phosphopantetheinyl transferase family protein n=1 Tax=Streptomyces sp. NPDC048290 TaxID=3155811 RepID=UPI003428C3E3